MLIHFQRRGYCLTVARGEVADDLVKFLGGLAGGEGVERFQQGAELFAEDSGQGALEIAAGIDQAVVVVVEADFGKHGRDDGAGELKIQALFVDIILAGVIDIGPSAIFFVGEGVEGLVEEVVGSEFAADVFALVIETGQEQLMVFVRERLLADSEQQCSFKEIELVAVKGAFQAGHMIV